MATKPETTPVKIPVREVGRSVVRLQCEDCWHFQDRAYPEFKSLCSERGVRKYSATCEHLSVKVTRMASQAGSLAALAEMANSMDESSIRLFAYAATQMSRINTNTKFRFGQKVYFNLSAPIAEYLDSYYSGIVVGYLPADADSENGYLVVAGSLHDLHGTSITLAVEEFLSEKLWEKRRARLIKAGRLSTPSTNRIRFESSPETSADLYNYEPPTIDMDADLVASSKAPTRKKRKAAVDQVEPTVASSTPTRRRKGSFTLDSIGVDE